MKYSKTRSLLAQSIQLQIRFNRVVYIFHGKIRLSAIVFMLSSKLTQVVSSHFPMLNYTIRDLIKLQKYIRRTNKREQKNSDHVNIVLVSQCFTNEQKKINLRHAIK